MKSLLTHDEQETTLATLERISIDCNQLRTDLAEREAECLKLRESVNAILNGNPKKSHPQIMRDAREALSTPPSTSYLEQWVADNFEVVAYYEFSEIYNAWYLVYSKPPQGKRKPLYARKD